MTQRPAKFWEGSTLAELQALGSNDGLTVLDFGVVETGTPGVYQATTVNPTTSVWTATGGVGSVDLQQAYDNGSAIVTDAAGGALQISGTEDVEINVGGSCLVESSEVYLRATPGNSFFIDAPLGVIFDGAKQINATLPFKFDDGAGGFQIVRGATPTGANDLTTKDYVDSNAGEVNTASNIGTGEGVFSAKVGDDFEFKSLTASGLVSVSSSATEIDISTTAEANTASNLGGGEGVFSAKVGDDLQFRSLTAAGSVSLTGSGTEIEISSTGEANTASNIGAGEGVFSAKVGDDLEFKSITTSGPVSVSSTATEIDITSTAEANTASNLGGGEGIFASKVADDLQFKSVTSTGGTIAITSTATEVNIEAVAGGGEVNTASNIGGGEGVFASKVGTDLEFKSLTSPDGTIGITGTASEVEIVLERQKRWIQFSRRGNTQNNTFLRFDDVDCVLPSGVSGASGIPFWVYDVPAELTRISFRNRRPNPAGANLELIRCQGAAPGATVVSLGTIAIPAGAVEVDVVVPAGTVTIPLGNWTILCRRTTGGGGVFNAWQNCAVSLEFLF